MTLFVLRQSNLFCAEVPADSSPSHRIPLTLSGDFIYPKPKPFDCITKAPGDLMQYSKETFQKKNILAITLIVVGTGLLIIEDQVLVDKAERLGDRLNISHTAYQKTVISTDVPFAHSQVNLFEGPCDSGSALYFIGDGWVDVGIAGSFLTYGLFKDDNRALATASEMAESILTSGAIVQTLKHITGRESPFTTDTPRGVWRFFPNQITYAQNVPRFDAFPTGHLAAAMASFVVISENYPEKKYIRPLGYTLMGLLAFQMLNNGVHWASDYPLGMAVGYGLGKIAVNHGRHPRIGKSAKRFEFCPQIIGGGVGIEALMRFSGRKMNG
jgi:hypothetical protein